MYEKINFATKLFRCLGVYLSTDLNEKMSKTWEHILMKVELKSNGISEYMAIKIVLRKLFKEANTSMHDFIQKIFWKDYS